MMMLRRFFFFLIAYIPEPFYGWFSRLYNAIVLMRNSEKVCHFGEYDLNVIYYVIDDSCFGTKQGLATHYDMLLGYALHAQRKGMIPLYYTKDKVMQEKLGEIPILENFFCQCADTEEVLQKGANVVFANKKLITLHKRVNKAERKKRHTVSKMFAMRPEVEEYCKTQYKQLFNRGGQREYVGIYYRGTDYRSEGNWHPVGHNKVLGIEKFCDEVEKCLRDWKCNGIFFMTEEQEALDYFIEKFPQAVYMKKQRWSSFEHGESISAMVPSGTTRYENDLKYITDMYLLSKCDYLVAPFVAGVYMAWNMKDGDYKAYKELSQGKTF